MKRNGKPSSVLAAAFAASIPVLLGYVTIGIAFGLLLVRSGLPWWLAPLMSVVIYAGAAQFMAVGLFAAGTGLLEIAALTLFLNARHAVYGLSLLDRFAPFRRHKPYLVYALTDETYGILTTVEPPEGGHRGAFYTAVSALDQSYWVLGTAVGAIVGGLIPFDTTGLDFALTALFIVLLVEQTRTVRQSLPYLVAAFSTAVSLLAIGPKNLLIASICLAILLIFPFRKRLKNA
ncbi:MAG TPA: AzlC family ABC transporter permease [Rectinemataceae bacterium]|nr:AzlC family ABC transporter permease [Rectinemataceae bacterium]